MTAKRKRYTVKLDDGTTVGRYHSITSAVVAAYKRARRSGHRVSVWKGGAWLCTIDGA